MLATVDYIGTAEGDYIVKAWLRAAGAKWTVKVERYGKGSANGPVGNMWTEENCSSIPLCYAAQWGDLQRLEELIADGADVDEQNHEGDTALVVAAERGYAVVAEALLKAGAKIDLHNMNGRTALDRATTDDARALLRAAGAKLTVKVEGYGKGSANGPAGNTWTDETGDLVTISPGSGVWYEKDFYFVTRGEGICVKRDFEQ